MSNMIKLLLTMRKLQLVILSAVLLLTGCSTSEKVNSKDNLVSDIKGPADDFLKEKGYKVVSYEGMTNYTLTKEILLSQSEMDFWGVQKEKPDKYINKTLTLETFVVKNHPLDKKFQGDERYLKRVRTMVLYRNGDVIGGISFPTHEEFVGNPYSIDGKTIEEINGLDYQSWSEKWKSMYSK
ncbi:hypothetical protein [Peribacillus sp. SCS-37]|uniref:hypothetical protein n=1 Tax=Paraperibacillus esterisolvens TaxID=3115296 RepID=UPI00390697BB